METGVEKIQQSPIEAGEEYIESLRDSASKSELLGLATHVATGAALVSGLIAVSAIEGGLKANELLGFRVGLANIGISVFAAITSRKAYEDAAGKENAADILEGQKILGGEK